MKTLGKVRLLPLGAPGLPPRNMDPMTWCNARIEVGDLPMMAHDKYTIAYLCTRFPHPDTEVHVSESDPATSKVQRPEGAKVIVWGGE